MITFKQFLETAKPVDILHQFEDLLHHIAEEELVACKVIELNIENGTVVFVADCKDKGRDEGHQPDLSEKLEKRLNLHPLQHLNTLKVKVIHKDVDPR